MLYLTSAGQLVKQRCRRCSRNFGTHGPVVPGTVRTQHYSLVTSTTGHVIQIDNNELYELNEKISNEDRCSSCTDENGYLCNCEKRLNGSV